MEPIKSLSDAKDQVARKHGSSTWKDMVFFLFTYHPDSAESVLSIRIDEAFKLYESHLEQAKPHVSEEQVREMLIKLDAYIVENGALEYQGLPMWLEDQMVALCMEILNKDK